MTIEQAQKDFDELIAKNGVTLAGRTSDIGTPLYHRVWKKTVQVTWYGEQTEFDLQEFLRNVRKYTDAKELTAELLNDLVDKIIIHAPDKSGRKRRQKIEKYYKAAGIIDIYSDDCIAEDGRKERWQKSKTA